MKRGLSVVLLELATSLLLLLHLVRTVNQKYQMSFIRVWLFVLPITWLYNM